MLKIIFFLNNFAKLDMGHSDKPQSACFGQYRIGKNSVSVMANGLALGLDRRHCSR
jgi:hypothetical protein